MINKNYTVEQQIEHEFNKIKGDKRDQDAFFGKAIVIQNKAWDESYADYKLEIACEVLCLCGYCNPRTCNRCQLTAANQRAHLDIQLGLRRHGKEVEEKTPNTSLYFTDKEVLAIQKACDYMANHFTDDMSIIFASIVEKVDRIMEELNG